MHDTHTRTHTPTCSVDTSVLTRISRPLLLLKNQYAIANLLNAFALTSKIEMADLQSVCSFAYAAVGQFSSCIGKHLCHWDSHFKVLVSSKVYFSFHINQHAHENQKICTTPKFPSVRMLSWVVTCQPYKSKAPPAVNIVQTCFNSKVCSNFQVRVVRTKQLG